MPFCLRDKLAGEAPICTLEILSLNSFQRKKNDGKLSKELFAERLVLGNLQALKPCLLPCFTARSLGIHREKGIECIHEKRLAETARPGNEIHEMARLHHRLNEGRFIDIVVFILDQSNEGRIADYERFFHSVFQMLQQVILSLSRAFLHPTVPRVRCRRMLHNFRTQSRSNRIHTLLEVLNQALIQRSMPHGFPSNPTCASSTHIAPERCLRVIPPVSLPSDDGIKKNVISCFIWHFM